MLTLSDRRVAVVLAALTAWIAACSNPVSSDTHHRPTGFDLLVEGQPLVSESDGALSGSLELAVGQQVPVTVRFREGASVITPGGDYFLEIQIANTAVATFTPSAPGAFTGTFAGVAPGATTMRVRWMHGRVGSPRAHHDYQSAPVPVVITPLTPPPSGSAGA